ncbi:MAG: hypothetical protein WBD74_02915 [Candidatus Aquilonibacter sp.]
MNVNKFPMLPMLAIACAQALVLAAVVAVSIRVVDMPASHSTSVARIAHGSAR